MRRNGLITGLLLLLGIVVLTRVAVQFGLPSYLTAQTSPSAGNVVGPHAAFFDAGGNIKIANLAKEKASGKNLPITVMINLGASGGEINSIISATSGLTPIIRVVGIDSTSTQDLAKATQLANNLKGINFPPGTLVVLGNELNNLEKEWKNVGQGLPGAGAQYGAFFQAFKDSSQGSSYIPVPAPLDIYNAKYDWKPFFDAAQGAYSGDLVANAYDLSESQGINLYKEYEQRGGGTVRAFTEYGPNPSKSLQEHLNFYKNNPPSLPATTLIPDKCKSSDHQSDLWLYYIDGKIYDAEGNEISPTSCDKSSTRAGLPPAGDYYKRFVYPFYSEQSTVEDIKKRLESDYSVMCANPANYGTSLTGSIEELIQYQSSACRDSINSTACLFSPDAIFSLDATGNNRLFGVMRNENEAKWRAYDTTLPANESKRAFTNRFESVEQWFGANNPPEGSELGQAEYTNQTPEQINPLHQGPYFKLSTLSMQCQAAGEILQASADLCQEWSSFPENAGQKCGLIEKKVSGTTKTYGQLRDEVLGQSGNFPAFCEAVYNAPDPKNVPSNLKSLASDVSKVDLYMETAYRPAFLVLTTGVDPLDLPKPAQKFNTKDQGPGAGHVVDFLIYHVPDTITDIQDGTPGAVDDVITRTAKTFISLESTQKFAAQYNEKRAAVSANLNNPGIESINCRGGKCDEKLRRALIDFINAYILANPDAEIPGVGPLNCQTPHLDPAESGSRIGSELAPNDTPDNLRQGLKNGEPIDKAKVEVNMDEYRDKDGVIQEKDPRAQTFIYNVVPYGMRTEYVAEAFDALFSEGQQSGQFKENDKYLTSFEAIFGDSLTSTPDIIGYTANTKPVLGPDGKQLVDAQGNPVFQGEQKDVRDEVTLLGNPPFSARVPWLAKVFNLSTRAIVQQISSAGENLLECARSIADPKKNTEDFLLKCQSRGSAVGNTPQNAPNQYTNFAYNDFQQFEIQYWNGSMVQFSVPPTVVWDAAVAANQRHTKQGEADFCDPLLVIAVAHSESQSYTNHINPNHATARGVWQFTSAAWRTWWTAGSHQASLIPQVEGQFDCRNSSAEDTCSPTNISAAADAACRLIHWTGMTNHLDNQSSFVRTFAVRGDNPYGQVWNLYPPQGEYVWRLWNSLKKKDFTTYRIKDGTYNQSNNSTNPPVNNSPTPATASCASGQTCMSAGACSLIFGTAGASCGGGNICCKSN